MTGHPANAASGRWIWCSVTLMSVMSATKGAARDCNWHLDGPDRPAVTASSQRLAGQACRGVKFTAAEPSSGQALWPAFDGDLLNCQCCQNKHEKRNTTGYYLTHDKNLKNCTPLHVRSTRFLRSHWSFNRCAILASATPTAFRQR